MNKATQSQMILDFIDRYGSINPMQALNYLGVMRLAARINDLEKAGVKIEHEPMKAKNRFGETINFMQYKRAV